MYYPPHDTEQFCFVIIRQFQSTKVDSKLARRMYHEQLERATEKHLF